MAMKFVIGALASVLLAGMAWIQPAAAQGLPQGSYLRSCNGAAMHGDTLVATCRRPDGREQRTSLAEVRRCRPLSTGQPDDGSRPCWGLRAVPLVANAPLRQYLLAALVAKLR